MRIACKHPVVALLAMAAVGCGGGGFTGTHPSGTGPFDSRGNYVEAWADNPSKWNRKPSKPEARPEPEPPAIGRVEPPAVARVDPQPRPQVTQPRPSPPPPKPKPKPKPQFAYHTVSKGDTLYGLAKRYGTTVSKIQKANGISGSLIRPGQKLKIPR